MARRTKFNKVSNARALGRLIYVLPFFSSRELTALARYLEKTVQERFARPRQNRESGAE